jgi:uncharacterized protein YgbK (DUF1537 family)
MGVPDEPPQDTAAFEVIALKIRTEPVADACAQALAALAWLQQAGAQRFFWKYCSTFDSTAEGNIGPVSEALMEALGLQQTVYCPAFPENGRRVVMGDLFVGDQLLSKSPMKDHPLTPMRDSNLVRLLQPQVQGDVSAVDLEAVRQGAKAVRAGIAEGAAHVVLDAAEGADLEVLTEACHDMPLLTGGSALAMGLPAIYAREGLYDAAEMGHDLPQIDGPAVVLSGSCSAMTQAQVADLGR